ncbi:MAG: hypothetical protein HYT13_02870 [Candidatus Liptonbacteria bacterium]|nr:hypothetical protein [Candidatus Liptonbacteria bacterium]
MKPLNYENIDLSKLETELEHFQNKWIAISAQNKIVSSGRTYGEALEKARKEGEVVLFRVPPLDAYLAP